MIFLKRRALMTRASFNYKTVSGIGSAVLENCVETRFKRLELLGNSTQTTTNGINLLPFKVWEKIISSDEKCEAVMKKDGVDITIKAGSVNDVISDIYFIRNGNGLGGDESAYELFKEGDYTFINNTNNQLYLFVIVWRNGEKKILIQGSRVILNNFTINKNDKVRIFLRPSNTLQTYFLGKASVMLCKHTETNLPYEPYTGGKPSPSVEYPQEIKSAGKLNADTGKYDIDVQVIRNLFNHTKAKSGWIATSDGKQSLVALGDSDNVVSDYIRVNPGMMYTPSAGVYKYFYDSEKNFLKYETLSSSIIIPNNVKYMIVIVPVNRAIVIQAAKKLIIYESDSEQQTLQLQLDEPLRGIGEYKDVITKDGILRRIKEIVLDESTGFETYWATLDKTFAFISPTIKDATVINFTPNRLLCNYFKNLPDSFDRTDEEVCTLFNRRFHVRFLKERNIDTVEKLKEWLKQNPIKIQYLLQEPVLEPFENSLDSLHTNEGTTIVSVDSGEVETGIEVEYAIKN